MQLLQICVLAPERLNKTAEMSLFLIKRSLGLEWSPGPLVTVVVKKEDTVIRQNRPNESCRHLALFHFELLLSGSRCKYKKPLAAPFCLTQKDQCLQPAVWQLYFYEVSII